MVRSHESMHWKRRTQFGEQNREIDSVQLQRSVWFRDTLHPDDTDVDCDERRHDEREEEHV